jgi:hypothetical protein
MEYRRIFIEMKFFVGLYSHHIDHDFDAEWWKPLYMRRRALMTEGTFDDIDNLLDTVLPLPLRLLFIPLLTAFTHSTYSISIFLQLLLAVDSLLWLKTLGE